MTSIHGLPEESPSLPASRRSRRDRRIGQVVALASAVYLAWLVIAHWREINRAVLRFEQAQIRWLLAAIGFEIVSQALDGVVEYRLLRRAGSTFGRMANARLVLAQNAISMALPGGQAVASVFSYRQIRRRGGANSSAAAWVVAASNLTAMLALATFGLFTATGFSWLTLLSGSVLLVALGVIVIFARNPYRLTRPAVALARARDRLGRHRAVARPAEQRVAERFERLSAVQMAWNDWVFVGVFALGAVAADCAVWFCASHAVIVRSTRCLAPGPQSIRAAQACAGFHAPTIVTLLVAYSAGQAALQLPLPGGIGAVEAFMTAALTATKVRAIQALSAVLLYRLIAFWSVAAVGTVMWVTLRRGRRGDPATEGGPASVSRDDRGSGR